MRYRIPQVVLMPRFLPRERHLSSGDAKSYLRFLAPKPNKYTRKKFHVVYDVVAVDFLHHESPPICAGVEPVTLDADSRDKLTPPRSRLQILKRTKGESTNIF
ncbi:hypothetical protein TNCV_4611751 [Trichonephila clavipes]|nr:hypothetical protein TNCV_4611751 [Trichonephila clavipes]